MCEKQHFSTLHLTMLEQGSCTIKLKCNKKTLIKTPADSTVVAESLKAGDDRVLQIVYAPQPVICTTLQPTTSEASEDSEARGGCSAEEQQCFASAGAATQRENYYDCFETLDDDDLSDPDVSPKFTKDGYEAQDEDSPSDLSSSSISSLPSGEVLVETTDYEADDEWQIDGRLQRGRGRGRGRVPPTTRTRNTQ